MNYLVNITHEGWADEGGLVTVVITAQGAIILKVNIAPHLGLTYFFNNLITHSLCLFGTLGRGGNAKPYLALLTVRRYRGIC